MLAADLDYITDTCDVTGRRPLLGLLEENHCCGPACGLVLYALDGRHRHRLAGAGASETSRQTPLHTCAVARATYLASTAGLGTAVVRTLATKCTAYSRVYTAGRAVVFGGHADTLHVR